MLRLAGVRTIEGRRLAVGTFKIIVILVRVLMIYGKILPLGKSSMATGGGCEARNLGFGPVMSQSAVHSETC